MARALDIDIDAAVEGDGWGVLKRYVEADIGISIVPSLCLSETDRLSVLALEPSLPRQSYGVFTARGQRLTRAVRRFFDVLIPNPQLPPADE